MGATNMPAAEIDVRSIFRLGGDLTVRLPRREAAARLIDHEQAVLPGLSDVLPIPIPAPVRFGPSALGYPWSWSVNPWIAGTNSSTSSRGRTRRHGSTGMCTLHSADNPTMGAIGEQLRTTLLA